MVKSRASNIILWPTYFDIKRSRDEGRRVPRSLGVDNPNVEDIYKAVKKLGHKAKMETDKSHPGTPTGYEGRVLVDKTGIKKTYLIAQVAAELKK
ncbi:MAG: signal recognition particle subunit SRP19/SEC65 family protein [Thermoplasmata archaeon]|nr:signal recognition particle subunit SRP19/SEC65 family protein [Thermoplasmata archaeon]